VNLRIECSQRATIPSTISNRLHANAAQSGVTVLLRLDGIWWVLNLNSATQATSWLVGAISSSQS